ncbi:CocE/NonD family hydrolase [bacterium]|nr:CocE/NonD family hydrolase [bacterium]
MVKRILLCLGLSLSAAAQAPDAAKERAAAIHANYGKYEFRIPVRDGKRLFTSVYLPNGVHFGKKYPILLMRTPYSVGPYGPDRYRDSLAPIVDYEKEGFIFVFQDVRGRWMSEGDFVNMRPCQDGAGIDEATDTYDSIEWLLKNVQGNNGRVGMWGISYPGFYAAYGAIQGHPALKAISPQAPIADWFRGDDMHRNGAFNLQMSFGFFANFGKPRPEPSEAPPKNFEYPTNDAYQYFLDLGPLSNALKKFGFENAFWHDIVAHPNYDPFWQSRNLLPHLQGIKAATMVVAGWYDTEDLYGPLHIYQSIRRLNPNATVHLVAGPWYHGGWWRADGSKLGAADFGTATSQTYQKAELAFFQQHLKNAEPAGLPGAWVFETGANRWRSFSSWPPPQARPLDLYLADRGNLNERPGPAGHDEFVSDPARPVPYTADNSSVRQSKDYMAEDQRFAARRPDVLVYQGPELEDEMTVAGPIEVSLWVSTSRQDADWIVKLIDVNPGKLPSGEETHSGGQQTLVRGEPFRGRFRESFEHPKAFEPNQATRLTFTLNDVCHTFMRHHRVMVQVQSSWFPYIDRNPQNWVENIFKASDGDFVKATHRVYFGESHGSHLRFLRL